MSSTYVAHCTTDEQVLGVWVFPSDGQPYAFYPPTPVARMHREYAERRLADLTGWDTTTESVIDRLVHSMNPDALWFVLENPDRLSAAELFVENGGDDGR